MSVSALILVLAAGAVDADAGGSGRSEEFARLSGVYGPATMSAASPDGDACVPELPRFLGQPSAWIPSSPLMEFTWEIDSARNLVLFERDGKAEGVWFLASPQDHNTPGTTMIHPNADEPGWLAPDIDAALAAIGWSERIGKRLGCDPMATLLPCRAHQTFYFAHGIAAGSETNLVYGGSFPWCGHPFFRRFLVSPVHERTGRVAEVLLPPEEEGEAEPPVPDSDDPDDPFDSLNWLDDALKRTPAIEVDGLRILVNGEEARRLSVGDTVRYAVDTCGRVLGLWPPENVSKYEEE